MTEVRVARMQIREKRLADGSTRLAFLEAILPGVRLIGCTLVRGPDGRFEAQPPGLSTDGRARLGVELTSPELRAALTAAAVGAYQQAGGEP